LKNQSDFKLIYRKKKIQKSRSKKFQDYENIIQNTRNFKKIIAKKKKKSQQQTDQRSIFSMKGTIIVSLS